MFFCIFIYSMVMRYLHADSASCGPSKECTMLLSPWPRSILIATETEPLKGFGSILKQMKNLWCNNIVHRLTCMDAPAQWSTTNLFTPCRPLDYILHPTLDLFHRAYHIRDMIICYINPLNFWIPVDLHHQISTPCFYRRSTSTPEIVKRVNITFDLV